MKPYSQNYRHRGFTLTEVLISMSIATAVLGMSLSVFLYGARIMYHDSQRLETDRSLRQFMQQITSNTLESSKFYIFPSYKELDGSVDFDDVSAIDASTNLADGNCLVLVTHDSLASNNPGVLRIQVYFKGDTYADGSGNVLYLSRKYSSSSNATSLKIEAVNTTATVETLLNADFDLKSTTVVNSVTKAIVCSLADTKNVATRVMGRPKPPSVVIPPFIYGIFTSPTPRDSSAELSINAELINGTSALSQCSSSSLNYTINPRR